MELLLGHSGNVVALDSDETCLGALQSEHAAQQHGLARAGAADDAEHLVLVNLHGQPVVHDLRTEPVDQATHLQDGIVHTSISRNRTANSASAKITRKIDCTTAIVVRRPSSLDDPRTCIPR